VLLTVNDNFDSADLELVISGVSPSRDGQSERQRLDVPVRFKLLVTQATADGAGYQINRTPVTRDELMVALQMAHVRQLDRIGDLLERVCAHLEERKK
jgi:hypothetical protein